MKFAVFLLASIFQTPCDAAIPTSITTVVQFNEFLQEKDIGSAQDTWTALSHKQLQALYEDFLATMGSTNDDGTAVHTLGKQDYEERYATFKQSVQTILKLTEQTRKDGDDAGPYFGITSNVDMSEERIAKRTNHYLGAPSKIDLEEESAQVLPSGDDELFAAKPQELAGTCGERQMNQVRQQGTCGSCWAFATAEQVRYDYQRRYGSDPGVLSAQYLIDCARGQAISGCNGGNTEQAISWMIANGGIPTKAAYGPYLNRQGVCKSGVRKAVMPGPSFNSKSEAEAYKMYCSYGPFTISIDGTSIQHYTGGVMTPQRCSTRTNHRVIVVGIISFQGRWAWVIQNSWGAGWGVRETGARSNGQNGGYILMAYNANTCGLASEMTFLAGIFSVGAPHPWLHNVPLVQWTKYWGPYPGVHFTSHSSPLHQSYKGSLALCEASAEAIGDTMLTYAPASRLCVTTGGGVGMSSGSGATGAVYQIGDRPAGPSPPGPPPGPAPSPVPPAPSPSPAGQWTLKATLHQAFFTTPHADGTLASASACASAAAARGSYFIIWTPATHHCSVATTTSVSYSYYSSGAVSYLYQRTTYSEDLNLSAKEDMLPSGVSLVAAVFAVSALAGAVTTFFVARKQYSFGSRQPLLENA